MGIYYGYFLFRKNKGALIDNLDHPKTPPSALAYINCPSLWPNCRVSIEFRRYLYLEEMVKSYIHELLHCAYHYNFWLDKNKERGFKNVNPYPLELYPSEKAEEDAMDRDVDTIYQMQPRLVARLRKDLEEAFIDLEFKPDLEVP